MAALAAGLNPTFPVRADVGTLEMSEPARTTKPEVDRRFTVGCTVVCGGVTTGGLTGEGSFFVQPMNMTARNHAVNPRAVSILEYLSSICRSLPFSNIDFVSKKFVGYM